MSDVSREEFEAVLERVEELEEKVEEKDERIAELEQRVDEQEGAATLEWDGGDHEQMWAVASDGTRYPLGRALESRVAKDEFDEELDTLRDRLADGDLGGDRADAPAPTGPTVTPETPLEDIVDLPEHVAESELNPNQRRARFVAAGAREYATKVPAGYVVSAGDMSRVLAAGTDTTPHSQTISRVMEFLEKLGGDHVDVVKKRGTKRVVFDEEIVDRLARITDEAHTVVRPDEGEECEATA